MRLKKNSLKKCSSTELYHFCHYKNNLQDKTELHVEAVVVDDEVVDKDDAYADSKTDCISKVD